MTTAPLLVVGVGNPSRGDDAVGPLFIERMGALLADEVSAGRVELLTDFQLQIEHALDLVGRERVVFVDASVRAEAPFTYAPVRPERDASHSSHALSPAAVLDAHQRVVGAPPEAWVLAIRGERFELGESLSDSAQRGLDAAVEFFANATRAQGARFVVRGIVQGVGYRPWVVRKARSLGVTGRVRNTSSAVVIEAYGEGRTLEVFERALQSDGPREARVEHVARAPIAWRACAGFEIEASVPDADAGLPIPADLSVCAACLSDVARPDSRHHGYAFTSCTDCGPRYAIIEALPYDRAHTTLRNFQPCAECSSEYRDASERRFHAQTLACPACGPRLWVADRLGRELDCASPLDEVARRLGQGEVVAIRGLGAFHLACDATSAGAVMRLRERKRRDDKPFAVMVQDLAAAEVCGALDETARAALVHAARPIVLVPAREGAVVPEVRGPSKRIGLLLPYTPLHHALLAAVGRPLVMTSGNVAGEPVVIDNDDAVRALAPLADALLLHDRPIARRVEDSVVAVHEGRVQTLRRARGFAPKYVRLPASSPEPVLAVGGQLKNTVCVVVDDRAYVSAHLGDLDTVESEQAWLREVESLLRLLRVRPEVVAHDLHPEYVATRHALARPARLHHGVQHHAAHVLAAVAELALEGPVLGVAFDGTGWGSDGTAWGGELLWVHEGTWRRLASMRPLRLAGGEVAIREIWRQALAVVVDAFGDDAGALISRLPVFAQVPVATRMTVERMLATGVQVVRARGVGRYFDAMGALVLGLGRSGFEGHAAVALEEAAHPGPAEPYPWGSAVIAHEGEVTAQHEVDLRPTTRALVADVLAGVAAPVVAARIHETWVAATVDCVERGLAATGAQQVVLAGGAFQNRRLASGIVSRLGAERAHLARELPVNDGGLSLGQAWSAVLALRGQSSRGGS